MSKESIDTAHTVGTPELATVAPSTSSINRGNRYKLVEISLIALMFAWVGLVFVGQSALAITALPFTWLSAIGLVLWGHQPSDTLKNALLFVLVSFTVGLLATYYGQETQVIFGSYTFTDALGYKLVHTPVMMGAVWVLFNYISGATIKQYFPFVWPVIQAVMSALLVTVLAFALEGVGSKLQLWQWANETQPVLHNALAWFDISFLLQLLFAYLVTFVNNRAAPVLVLLLFVAYMVVGATTN